MTHKLDRGDIIDILEEAITRKAPVTVVLANDDTFEDRVTEIVEVDGEDHAIFHVHGSTPLRKITKAMPSSIVRA